MRLVKLRYTLIGFLIGIAFPICSTIIQIALESREVSIYNMLAVQQHAPLLWIIDSAPLVISILAYIIGYEIDHLNTQREELSTMSIIAKRTVNAVVITDKNKHIIWANDSFLNITQYTLEEIKGIIPGKLLQGPETDPSMIQLMKNAIDNLQPVEATLINYRKDGSKYFNSIEIIPVLNKDKELINFISLQRDVTKEILEVEGLKDSYNKTIESFNKLNKITSYSIHNFRSPIKSIAAVVDLITENQMSIDDQGELLKSLKPLLVRADDTINGILKLSQSSSSENEIELIDITAMIHDILDSISHLNKQRIEKTVNIQDSVQLHCSKFRLQSVLENIITNSVKYHDPTKEKLKLSINVAISNDLCTISVEDNGIGIPEKAQCKVFEMFYRGTKQSHGSGLGLYIVKETVEQMNGTIQLESTEKVGTKISIAIENKVPLLAQA